jgi:hypothetical protein
MSSAIKAASFLKLIISLFLIINCTCIKVATKVENSGVLNSPESCEPSVPFVGTINVTVDDILEKITRNGHPLSLVGVADLGDWTKAKTFNVNHLRAGDLIAITGKNNGPYSANNPGGILATITYKNSRGQIRTINTSDRWRCNNMGAREEGKNKFTIPKTIWFIVNNNSPIDGIDSNAQWIWSQNLAAPCVICSIRLPEC